MRKYSYGKCLILSAAVVLSLYGFEQLVVSGQNKGENRTAAEPAVMGSADREDTEGESLADNAAFSGVGDSVSGDGAPGEEAAGPGRDVPKASDPGSFHSAAADAEVFHDALFIGDSRTVGLMEYGDLGAATVFADSGMSVFKVWETQVKLPSGEKCRLQQVLEEGSFGKIYIMLGLNELGYPYESIVAKYRALLEEVRRLQPEAEIFLEANLHVSEKRSSSSDIYNNAAIDRLNGEIREMAEEKGAFYLDINVMFDDAGGNLDAQYTVDDAHVLGKYYMDWSGWLAEETVRALEG